MGPTAAEDLAHYLGQEVEKMVVKVTSCGGDVIKFAGDCIIAVFPADDYVRQSLCLVCSHRLRVAQTLPLALRSSGRQGGRVEGDGVAGWPWHGQQ